MGCLVSIYGFVVLFLFYVVVSSIGHPDGFAESGGGMAVFFLIVLIAPLFTLIGNDE